MVMKEVHVIHRKPQPWIPDVALSGACNMGRVVPCWFCGSYRLRQAFGAEVK